MARNTGIAITGTSVLTSMEGKQSCPSTLTVTFKMSGHKFPVAVAPEGNWTLRTSSKGQSLKIPFLEMKMSPVFSNEVPVTTETMG